MADKREKGIKQMLTISDKVWGGGGHAFFLVLPVNAFIDKLLTRGAASAKC